MISAAWDWYYGSTDEELLAECEFGEPYSTKRCSNKDVCTRPATLSNGLQVTVFTQVKTRPKEYTDLEKSSNRLKLLRHPNILRHLGIVITETEVHLVTERVSPLYLKFETADANEVSTGIYDVAQALKFLHERAQLTHNSVSIESIYITEGGAWKLSNFESACSFTEATAVYLEELKRLKPIIPPEERDKKVTFPIEKKYAHCRDVYALGILLGLFNKQTRFASEVQTQELQDFLEEILQKDYKARPQVSELLDTTILTSEYIEIINFLQSITLKSTAEKTKFFSQFIPRLKKACISDELIAKRIAKLLLSPVVLSENEAVEKILPRLLTPIPVRPVQSPGLVTSSMFARYVIPQIVDLLDVRILHVRLVLVNNFHRFVHMFDKSILQETVLPELLLGLYDSNNQLVRASLHALAESVPIVGGDMIVGTEREKIFSFGMPKFNGSVLVDASSLAFELKPKRQPKNPKKKSPNRPTTLLELAMRRQKSPTKVTKTQRDLMMLKQNELAVTLMVPLANGDAPHHAEEDVVLEIAYNDNSTPLKDAPQENGVSHDIELMVNEVEKLETVQKNTIPEPGVQKTKEIAEIINEKQPRPPEIETWAGSESETEDTWADFDAFEGESTKHSNTSIGEENDPSPLSPVAPRVNGNGSQVIDDASINHLDCKLPVPALDDAPPSERPPSDDLATEFEIAVKVGGDEDTDFFADMVPEIPSRKFPALPPAQNITRIQERADSLDTESISTKSSPISVSFAIDELADDEATDGWENDAVAWDD